MEDISIPELNVPFVFRDRPAAVKGDLRPLWRMSLIVMLLRKCCRQNRTSFARLHVLNWALIFKNNQLTLLDLVKNKTQPTEVLVRIEPFLNTAVNYCIGEGLLSQEKGDRLVLTSQGVNLADRLIEREDIFEEERRFMIELGNSLTEGVVNELFA
ncbi:MAG TPA: hypothetical protein PKA76_18370 [Pirellulaceae bacterium]|nr:hypothetical protein [Pirellulaceae bacterium]